MNNPALQAAHLTQGRSTPDRRKQEVLKTRLDHSSPLVFDTRKLGRRPGAMQKVSRSVPAPDQLGIEVISVPDGAIIELELRLESVMEGVLVTGTARAPLTGECVRCLEPLERELGVDFQEMYSYPDADDRTGGSATEADDDAEEETFFLEDDMIDLEPVLRDAVVLALPLQPVCREDCPGLCSECGVRLEEDPDHHHETVDNRWAALQELTKSGPDEGTAENQEK